MLAIYKKEMLSYFTNPIGYVFSGIFLLFSAFVCCFTTLLSQSYDTSLYFTVMIFALAILIPILTMRLFAEERKMRTEQLLLTAPISLTGMVTGKFFAAFTLYVGNILLSCINFIPLYVIASKERAGSSYASTNIGPVTSEIIGCVIGLILIGAAFVAIGTFISSLTENQLAASIITIAVILVFVCVGFIANLIDAQWVRVIIDFFSVLSRFDNFSAGIFDFAALFYYVSVCFVFLFLTVRVYEQRRFG